jgi:cyanophycinase
MVRAICCFVALTCACHVVLAESPFGTPEPLDANRPGTIVLHGGGRITNEFFDRFIELAGGSQARIVLVPSAGFDSRNYETRGDFLKAVQVRYSSWFALKRNQKITELTVLHTENSDDADRDAFVAPLKNATAVWFSGGDQARLNYRYVGGEDDTLFQTEVKNVLRRGGVVGGTSAGTAVIPEIMTMRTAQEGDGDPLTARVAHGLGLVDRLIVEQHFDTRVGRMERFLGLLKDNDRLSKWSQRDNAGIGMMGLAVDEPGAVELSGSSVRAWGPGHIHLFVKRNGGRTVEWHDIEPDELVNVEAVKGQDAYRVTRVTQIDEHRDPIAER